MNKYIKYVVESFFDDIEDVIKNDIISDDNISNLYYDEMAFINCKTTEDYTEFFMNNLPIQKIWDLITTNNITKYSDYKNILTPIITENKSLYNISFDNDVIIKFEYKYYPTIYIIIINDNFTIPVLVINIKNNRLCLLNQYWIIHSINDKLFNECKNNMLLLNQYNTLLYIKHQGKY